MRARLLSARFTTYWTAPKSLRALSSLDLQAKEGVRDSGRDVRDSLDRRSYTTHPGATCVQQGAGHSRNLQLLREGGWPL